MLTLERGHAGHVLQGYLGDTGLGVGVVTTFLPEMAAKLQQLQAAAAAEGIQTRIADFGGVRDQAMTNLLLQYRQQDYPAYVAQLAKTAPNQTPLPIDQWRPIAPWGQSFHDYGAAVDLDPYSWPAALGPLSAARGRLAQLAAQVGLRQPLPASDAHHFELPYSLAAVQNLWLLGQAQQLPDVTSVSLPSEVAAGNIPAASAIPTTDLQQLLQPVPNAVIPDVGITPPGSAGPSWPLWAAAGIIVLGGTFLVLRGIRGD